MVQPQWSMHQVRFLGVPGLGWAGVGGAEWEVPLPTATSPPSIGLALGPLCTGVSWTTGRVGGAGVQTGRTPEPRAVPGVSTSCAWIQTGSHTPLPRPPSSVPSTTSRLLTEAAAFPTRSAAAPLPPGAGGQWLRCPSHSLRAHADLSSLNGISEPPASEAAAAGSKPNAKHLFPTLV